MRRLTPLLLGVGCVPCLRLQRASSGLLNTPEWKTQDQKSRGRKCRTGKHGNIMWWVARRNIINVVRGRRADINMVLRLFWHFGVNSYQLAELSGPWIMTLRISFYAWLQLCFNFWCHLRLCIQLCQSTTVYSLDWSVFLSVHYTLILIHFAFHRRWSGFFHRCEIWSRVFQSCLFHPRIFHGPVLSIPAFSASPWLQ